MTRPVVVKLGGALIDQPDALRRVCADIATAPEPVVIVHGGGATADQWLETFNIHTPRVGGLRATPDAALPVVAGALAGWTNTRLVAALAHAGARAIGLSITAGNAAIVQPATDPALGHVGHASPGDGALLAGLLAGGLVPVLHSIAITRDGQVLNVNADDAAAAVAASIGAARLVLLTDVPGVLDAHGAPITELTAEGADQLIATGVIAGGMIPKTRAALHAARVCAAPVVIASWRDHTWLNGNGGTRVNPAQSPAPNPAPNPATGKARHRPSAAPC